MIQTRLRSRKVLWRLFPAMIFVFAFCGGIFCEVQDEVGRVLPKEPAEAVGTFRVPDGFHMDLIAQEPLITSPVAMAYDENGNMYVAEMVDFPFVEKDGKSHGRVRFLQDLDGDGKFETSHIFVDGLCAPSSVACWKGGIFVTILGEIWY